MVQTVGAEADRSGREGAPSLQTIRLVRRNYVSLLDGSIGVWIGDFYYRGFAPWCRSTVREMPRAYEPVFALLGFRLRRLKVRWKSVPDSAPSYPRFLPPKPGDEAWAREAFRADGAPTRHAETQATPNGMTTKPFPSPSQEEG